MILHKNVVLIAGYSGSGKTLIARLLAERLNWPVLDKDTLAQPFTEKINTLLTNNPHDRESNVYIKEVRMLEYESLLATGKEILHSGGLGVILVAPFVNEVTDPIWIKELEETFTEMNARLSIVWIKCEEKEMRKRIINRNAERDKWKINNWSKWCESLDLNPLLPDNVIVINNDDDCPKKLENNTRIILSHLIPNYSK